MRVEAEWSRLGDARCGFWYVLYLLTVKVIPCESRGSKNLHKFKGEIAMHFRGLKNLDVSSAVVVCLDCGAAQLAVREAELRQLQKGKVSGAG